MNQHWSLADLLAGWVTDKDFPEDIQLTGLALDSREVQQGMLFVALQGVAQHGLQYAEAAVMAGAVAVIWERKSGHEIDVPWLPVPLIAVEDLSQKLGDIAARFYRHPADKMQVIGITGTDGKTSVSHFLAQALHDDLLRCGIIGTIGMGFPDALQAGTHTTPNAIRVQRTLRSLYSGGADYISMEVSSHALDQHRVQGVNFIVAALTNLTRDHLDYHLTTKAYADAKAKLFAWPSLQAIVLNFDDVFGQRLAAEATVPVQGYGLGKLCEYPEGTLVAQEPEFLGDGLRAKVLWRDQEAALQAPVLGHFNLTNLLTVTAILLSLGFELNNIMARLKTIYTVRGRMEVVATEPATVVVDYAHTPGALEEALQALRRHCDANLVCVFGCGGDRDRGKRPLMAAVAERLADRVILTDDNPRTEPADFIMQEMVAGLQKPEQVTIEHDRAKAIALAVTTVQKGDLVLIAGKGHETTQMYADKVISFDDRQKVRDVIKTHKGGDHVA